MIVAGLWRYPIKSLGGEPLNKAELTEDGVRGDRLVHAQGPRGLLTGRTRHDLLTLPVSTGANGRPLVAGHAWDGPEAAALVAERAGPDARLAAYAGPERFDVGNLLVATDGAVAALGIDVRRLRPNLLLGGVPAGAERDWGGRALAIGDALIGLIDVRARCVVTTIDPDTGAQDPNVLRRINAEMGGRVALDAWVIRSGHIRIGDAVELVDTDADPERIGGWVVGAPYRIPISELSPTMKR